MIVTYGGFREDAIAAFQATPDYFLFWDRLKTTALVVTLIALGWQISK